jgi:hypothetical protein
MITFRDNLTLATTKLRVRRGWLIVTLLVAGILFTVLIFGSLFIRGVLGSLTSFTKDGFLDRYIVTGTRGNSDYALMNDPGVRDRAKAINDQITAKKTAEAKRLGVAYDPKSDEGPVYDASDQGGPVTLNPMHPASRQALAERIKTTDTPEIFKKAAAAYHPTGFYSGFALGGAISQSNSSLTPIVAGTETQTAQYTGPGTDSIASFSNSATAMDSTMLQPFLFDGVSLTTKRGDAIPILAPPDALERLLGLKALPRGATPKQKIDRLSQLRQSSKNLPFDVCYRNKPAIELLAQAKSQAKLIKDHHTEAGYQAPTLQYAVPTTACTAVTVSRDTRNADEKKQDAAMEQFKAEFGAEAPATVPLHFRVVGIVPQPSSADSANDFSAFISSMFTTTLGFGWYIAGDAAQTEPHLAAIMNDPVVTVLGIRNYFVEFKNRQDQKAFIDSAGCQINRSSAPDCGKNGEKLFLMPYGNPLAALADAWGPISKTLGIGLLIIIGICSFVMMGTIGKVIADSRKETSVFRAVGAKRMDIAQIYLLYTAILGTLSFGLAVLLGGAVALWFEATYSGTVSADAVLAFNTHDLHKTFHLIGFAPLDMAAIYLLALGVSLLGALLPLLTNVSRNPVKDMRAD